MQKFSIDKLDMNFLEHENYVRIFIINTCSVRSHYCCRLKEFSL